MKRYTKEELEKIQHDVFFFLTEEEKLKVGVKGIAKIRYPEGSIYTGPVEFIGKSFEKIGYGVQDFTNSTVTCETVGGPIGDTLYLYEGMYDYKKTQWIYGDGIFYFLKDGKPNCYFPGYFSGTSFVREYQGQDLESMILPGFKNTKRLKELHPNQIRIANMIQSSKENTPFDFMLIGDSYFDFLNINHTKDNRTLTDVYSEGNNLVNYGIGGFRFCDFLPFVGELVKNSQPKNIIVNLGFNDIHNGKSASETLDDCRTFLKKIFAEKPDTRIYLLGVCHYPLFTGFRKEEDIYNIQFESFAKEFDNVSVIHSEDAFDDAFWNRTDWKDYIEPDLIHPNMNGYRLWMPRFLKEIDGYKLPKDYD